MTSHKNLSKKISGTLEEVVDFLNPLSGRGKPTEPEIKRSITRQQEHHGVTWVDIENPSRKEMAQLAEEYGFHSLHVEACLAKGQLDRIEKEDKYIFLLLHAPKVKTENGRVVTYKLCIFLSKKYVVTVHHNSHSSIADLFHEGETDEKKQETLFKKSPGHLLYHILLTLIKDLTEVLEVVLQEVDEIEETVFDVNVSGAYEISELRQKIVRQRRIISSFKNIAQELAADQSDLTINLTRYYKNVFNEINKLRESLEEAKETVEIYKDADFTVSTERTNKILGILTIIFTLGMPATIVGSFYGMNILMPGGIEAGSWTFWGPFTTFYLVVAMAIGPVLLMLLWFKLKRWF